MKKIWKTRTGTPSRTRRLTTFSVHYYGVDPPGWCNEEGEPSFSVLLATMFDLLTKHKWTRSSASDVWILLKAVMKKGHLMGSYYITEKMIRAHMDQQLLLVHCCVNDCVLFHDFQSEQLRGKALRNAHRTRCPKCNELRYYGNKKPRKVVYYFPCKYWLQGTI